MTKTIAIVGVTGAQGGSVANTFLQLPGWKVRGITRNTSSEAAQALAKRGVELVSANLDDKESLISAFRGANAIYLVTDFWQFPFNPEFGAEAAAKGKDVFEYALEREIAQGMNAAWAAADPEVVKTLDRFVFSMLSYARKWSKGKYNKVFHYDSKGMIEEGIQKEIPALAAKMSTVTLGYYIANLKMFPVFQPVKKDDGSMVFRIPSTFTFEIPFVDAGKDTGPFVKAVVVDLPAGVNTVAVTQKMDYYSLAALWGKATGIKTSVERVPIEELVAPLPEPMAVEMSDTLNYITDFGWCGGDPAITWPEDLGVKIEVSNLEDDIREEDWSSIL